MHLSSIQIEQFNQDGFLFFPSLFSFDEIKVLNNEAEKLFGLDREENFREKDGKTVRTNFAAHLYSEPYAKLSRHPRLLQPIMDILKEELYMHQFKINRKAAFDGDVWQWHQDYGTWKNDDDMPEARAMNIAIFLDEVNEFNGPLMFIPGSHAKGVVDASHDISTTSYPLWTIDKRTITKLVDKGGIISPKGPAGSVVMFHSCLVHSSTNNLSPWNRNSVYLSLCAVSNHIKRFKRPEFIAHRNFDPLELLPDNCLTNKYEVDLPWLDKKIA